MYQLVACSGALADIHPAASSQEACRAFISKYPFLQS